MNEFIDYVYSFYGAKDRLYTLMCGNDIVTKEDIFAAVKVYQQRLFNAYFSENMRYTWGGGDSLDRERVRDILIDNFHFSIID